MKNSWEQIGSIPVDAGIVMVGDPCYLLPDDGSHRDNDIKNWGKFCNLLDNNNWNSIKNSAIVVSSGYGDGKYPVYVRYQDGRIAEVKVVFIG